MIFECKEFLTKKEASKIIKMSDQFMETANVLGPVIEGYRVASNMWIDSNNPLIKRIATEISELTNLPIANQELPSVIRYHEGGEYKLHHDFFPTNQVYSKEILSRGGQRVKTALIYLNQDFTGGNTSFPYHNLTISPEIGKLVLWDNVKTDGSVDEASLHAGLPVETGAKYIMTIWIREKVFQEVNKIN